VEIEPAILVEGPVPQLVVTTPQEELELGPTRPAAARRVEVRLDAEAIPDDGSQVAVLSVDLVLRGGERPAIIQAFSVDMAGTGFPSLPMLERSSTEFDPFAGCEPGADCIRQFLVTFTWAGDEAVGEAHNWSVTLRRTDLVRAWSRPADLSASVEARYDVDPAVEPTKVHFEGDAIGVDRAAPPMGQLALATDTTSVDPLAPLLPVPAFMTHQASIITADPAATPGYVASAISFPGNEAGMKSIREPVRVGGVTTIFANPLAGCRIADACPDLVIKAERGVTSEGAELPAVDIHWSVDLLVYSFIDVPISLTANELR
jgi:hypothetical protein